MIYIEKSKCTGCRLCEKACPQNSISMNKRKAEIDITTCTICGICIDTCSKEKAISLLINRTRDTAKLKEYNGITVFIETKYHEINPISFEILGEARRLADSANLKVTGLIISDSDNLSPEVLFSYGADKVVFYKNKDYKFFRNELYSEITLNFIKEHKPAIFLAGASAIGRSFIPQVAAELKTGLTADCTKLEIAQTNSLLMGTRPAFGGNLMATIICEDSRPQFATVRQHVMKTIDPDYKREGTIEIIEEPDLEIKQLSSVLKVIEESTSAKSITESEIIVAGGYGLKSKENFKLIIKLANLLKGAFAASRSAVDSGWAPYSHQVGQTGKTVNPKLYLAFGISGAIQHIAGMQSSDYIIAVNSDPDADIFNIADIGICSDALEILPTLIKALEDKQ